jgi:two-component system LytT family response regulator
MRALIIDDEPMPAKHLRAMIEQHCFEITETEIIRSPKMAIEHLKEEVYDLIFLDVEMPEMDGFELLNHVELTKSTAVIFTTAYSEYAVQAFKANATYYIMKPVEEKELVVAVRKAIQKTKLQSAKESADKSLSIFDGEEYIIIKTKDIIRLEADGSYTKFILADRTILASKRMGYFSEKLPQQDFVRCHNSHIVNIEKIAKISRGKSGYLIMSNDNIVPVSPSKKGDLDKLINF